MDYKVQLEEIKKKVEEKKVEKAKLEERLDSLKKEQEKLLAQMKELGINSPDELQTEIEKLEATIQLGIKECLDVLK